MLLTKRHVKKNGKKSAVGLDGRGSAKERCSAFQRSQQKTRQIIFQSEPLLQAKFRPAYSEETLVAVPVEPISNKRVELAPKTPFLHETESELSSGEQLIGLPQGLFLVNGILKEKSCPENFYSMLDWLYGIWKRHRDLLLSDQRARKHLSDTLYFESLVKKSPSSFGKDEFMENMRQLLEKYPDYLECHWQKVPGQFGANKFADHSKTKEAGASHFLYIFNKKKKERMSVYRLYLNVFPNSIFSVAQFLIENIIFEESLPYTQMFKLSSFPGLTERKDTIILYIESEEEVHRIIEILRDYQQTNAHHFEEEVPNMTERLLKGIGFVHSPLFEYVRASSSIVFDCATQDLDRLLRSGTFGSEKSRLKFFSSKEATGILDKLGKAKESGFLPEGRSKAPSVSDLNQLERTYHKYCRSKYPELEGLWRNMGYTPQLGTLRPNKNTSFQGVRTSLISQALLDSLLATKDPNLFICRVWDYFIWAKLDFFSPHHNLQ
ncbi:MAG: T3SS effector HopA1 family protein [Cytophagales bacterium]|nr:T3SS effector HopA1 family protein [Cytophagales bacterium]